MRFPLSWKPAGKHSFAALLAHVLLHWLLLAPLTESGPISLFVSLSLAAQLAHWIWLTGRPLCSRLASLELGPSVIFGPLEIVLNCGPAPVCLGTLLAGK